MSDQSFCYIFACEKLPPDRIRAYFMQVHAFHNIRVGAQCSFHQCNLILIYDLRTKFPSPSDSLNMGFVSLGRSKQICKLCNKPQAVEIMLQKIIFKSSKKEGNTIIFTLAINAGDLIPISQNLEVPSPQMMEKIDLRGKNSFGFSMFRIKNL